MNAKDLFRAYINAHIEMKNAAPSNADLFITACKEGKVEEVKAALFNNDTTLDQYYLDRGFLQASYKGHLEVVKLLLSHGIANPNADTFDENSGENYALCIACRTGNTAIVRLLLEDGRVQDDKKVISLALTIACNVMGDVEIAKLLLQDEKIKKYDSFNCSYIERIVALMDSSLKNKDKAAIDKKKAVIVRMLLADGRFDPLSKLTRYWDVAFKEWTSIGFWLLVDGRINYDNLNCSAMNKWSWKSTCEKAKQAVSIWQQNGYTKYYGEKGLMEYTRVIQSQEFHILRLTCSTPWNIFAQQNVPAEVTRKIYSSYLSTDITLTSFFDLLFGKAEPIYLAGFPTDQKVDWGGQAAGIVFYLTHKLETESANKNNENVQDKLQVNITIMESLWPCFASMFSQCTPKQEQDYQLI